jgi:16S rRNA (cytosine1402-N4)-methyltransferase
MNAAHSYASVHVLPCAKPGAEFGAEPDGWEEFEDMSGPVSRFVHTSVMLGEIVEALSLRPGGVYVDVTLGGGGHSEAVLEAEPGARVLGFDRDPRALEASRERLARFGDRFVATKASFDEVPALLRSMGLEHVDGLIADLGVSSPQLDDPSRGMSFRHEGPLDMRMDPTRGETAAELISRLSTDEIADLIFIYGEERRSRRIARCVKQADEAGELITTLDLRRAVVRAVGPARIGGVDPATRSFQALRIAVNDELGQIEALLAMAPEVVVADGVFTVLAFHSLEDRLIKRAFQQRSIWSPLWRKPRVPTDEECTANPRARSAKLRAARRVDAVAEGFDYDDDDDPMSERGSWGTLSSAEAEAEGEALEASSTSTSTSLPPPSSSSPSSRSSTLPPAASFASRAPSARPPSRSASSAPPSSRGSSLPPPSERALQIPPASVTRVRALHVTARSEGGAE